MISIANSIFLLLPNYLQICPYIHTYLNISIYKILTKIPNKFEIVLDFLDVFFSDYLTF